MNESRPIFYPLQLILIGLLLLILSTPALARGESFLTRRDGLPSDGITALAWDGEGLWVGTIGGLGYWADGRAGTIPLPLSEPHILALHAEGDTLWVGSARGIARLAGGRWTSWQRGDAGLNSGWATSFVSHDGALHVGSYGGGVQRWDGERWIDVGQGAPPQVLALASDGSVLWAGTPRGIHSLRDGVWQSESLPGAPLRVSSLQVGEETVWAGGERGLYRRSRLPREQDWSAVEVDGPVSALEATPEGIIAATRRGLLLVEAGQYLPGEPPGAPISALLHAGHRLFAGTMGRGLWLEGEKPVEQVALPVVLIHGLGDSNRVGSSNLRFLAQWLRQDGHAVALAPSDPARPLLHNVALLRRTVAALRQETGQERVILLAHSFGGLVGRAYLASNAHDVAGLVTLGTPHAGANLVYDFLVDDLAESDSPSTRELLPEHLALLAPFMEQGGFPQLHIGGSALPRGALFEGFPAHDGIITAASATAAPGATRVESLLHGWTFRTLQYGLPSLTWPDALYLNTLRPWIQSVQRGEPWEERAALPSLSTAGFTSRVLLDRPLAPGERIVLPVPQGGGAATWLLESDEALMSLIAPDGNRYEHDRTLVAGQVAHLPYRENVLRPLDIWGTRGQPGEWQVELNNPAGHPAPARLVLIEPQAPPLEITVEPPWVEPGAPVEIHVRGEAGLALSARSGEESVPLNEETPGRYRGRLSAPALPGYHPLLVEAGSLQRLAVIGSRSQAWRVEGATVRREGARLLLRLTVQGEGQLAIGLRLLEGERVIASRLVGPYRLMQPGRHSLTVPLTLEDGERGSQLEWQLFDANRALIPIGPTRTTMVEP